MRKGCLCAEEPEDLVKGWGPVHKETEESGLEARRWIFKAMVKTKGPEVRFPSSPFYLIQCINLLVCSSHTQDGSSLSDGSVIQTYPELCYRNSLGDFMQVDTTINYRMVFSASLCVCQKS